MKGIIGSLASLLMCSAAIGSVHEPITSYEIRFSQADQLIDNFIARIEAEKSSIKIATYSLMDRKIASALIAAHRRGVAVEILVDPFSIKSRGPSKKIAKSELPFYVWCPKGPKFKGAKQTLNDAFCLFGNQTVWAGAFNFTGDVKHNVSSENVIILEQEAVSIEYAKEFERMKKEGSLTYEEFIKARS